MRTPKHGFTIVELLIVIVVIAILAAVTIVAYNGITQRTKESSVMSDLANSYKKLSAYKISTSSTDSFPTAIDCGSTPAANTICLKPSNGASFYYSGGSTGFCLKEINGDITYSVSSKSSTPVKTGMCNAGVVTTLATATVNGLAVDGANTVYAATNSHKIVTINSSGTLTDFAGTGTAGYQNGSLSTAQFNNPGGMVFDSAGNMYIADTNNFAIRKITPAGVVSIFAGSTTQTYGTQDGTGTGALFRFPKSIDIDSAGNLYVADYTILRKITPAGVVTTLGSFMFTHGVAVDKNDNVYVSEGDFGNRIFKITPSGTTTLFAGPTDTNPGYQDGQGTNARFYLPYSLVMDKKSDTLYVVDMINNCIRTVDMTGNVGTLTGLCGSSNNGLVDGGPGVARFYYPYGAAVDANGILYIGDGANNRVRVIR